MLSLVKRAHPGLTERADEKTAPFPPVSDPRDPRVRVQIASDPHVVRKLRVDRENRILRVQDFPVAHGYPAPPPREQMLGRTLDECAGHPALVEHWLLALEQCRALQLAIPITYQWEHPERPVWVVRTAYFLPRPRGHVEIYVQHLGTLEVREEEPPCERHSRCSCVS